MCISLPNVDYMTIHLLQRALLVHCHARCHQLSRKTWVLIRNLIPTSLTSVLGLPISFLRKGIKSVLDLDISFRLYDRSGTRYRKGNMDSFPDRFYYLWVIMFSFSVWLNLCENYTWVFILVIRLNEEDSQKTITHFQIYVKRSVMETQHLQFNHFRPSSPWDEPSRFFYSETFIILANTGILKHTKRNFANARNK